MTKYLQDKTQVNCLYKYLLICYPIQIEYLLPFSIQMSMSYSISILLNIFQVKCCKGINVI